MNRTQRIAIWLATLVITLALWKVFGQGFGNFRSDQPFLARNYPTSLSACDNFSPTNLAGLMFWLDAGYGVTGQYNASPTNGEKVKAWADKGTNNFWFTNYYNGDAPLYGTSVTTNGLPSMTGVSGNQGNLVGKTGSVFSQPNTVFVVVKTPASSVPLYDVIMSGTNGSSMTLIYAGPGIQPQMFSPSLKGPTVPSATWIITTYIANSTNSSIRTNGAVNVSGDGGTSGFEGVSLFSDSSRSQPWNNPIAEYVFFNRSLTTNEICQVENYLACKYALTNANLSGLLTCP